MYFVSAISSAVTIVGSQEPLWVAVLQPARAISTSCALVSRTVCFSRTERFTVTNTRILSVTRYENIFPVSQCDLLYCLLIISFIFIFTLNLSLKGLILLYPTRKSLAKVLKFVGGFMWTLRESISEESS